MSSQGSAIYADGGSNNVLNAGALTSRGGKGVEALDDSSRIENASTGRVSGLETGILASGGHNTVVNAGTVTSQKVMAIYATGGDTGILNTGNVIGYSVGVQIGPWESTAGTGNCIENGGTIAATHTSQGVGILIHSVAGEASELVNRGSVSGSAQGILGGAGDETVINAGLIEGDVSLGSGADVYLGVAGLVLGSIGGSAGDDLLVGGTGEDHFLGREGDDTLNGRSEEDLLEGARATTVSTVAQGSTSWRGARAATPTS